MFKKFAAVQWFWFWATTMLIAELFGKYSPYTMGNILWAGMVVVFFTWIITLVVKRVKKQKEGDL